MPSVEKKKDLKRTGLLDAAYELFVTKGVNATVIDDIVKKAGVAKGTFYLYFKDKYDLLDQLVLHKSAYVIGHALSAVEARRQEVESDFKEDVFYFIDRLLAYFVQHKDMLRLIRKNLSKGLFRNQIVADERLHKAVGKFTENFMSRGETQEEALQTLYVLVEMAGSVCCDAILDETPYPLDVIKPTLYRLIGKLLC